MRGNISKHWQLIASALFSAILISGAYIFATSPGFSSIAQASTETALLQAIATKDSDGDGLPDWEEVLYGTDPHMADSFKLGMTDGEAVTKGLIVPKATTGASPASTTPVQSSGINYAADGLPTPTEGTITDGFAKTFFTLYVAAKNANGGTELTADQVDSLANQALTSLSETVTPSPDFKTDADLKVSGTGQGALRTFATAAEAVLVKNVTNATKSDLEYFQDAIQNNDPVALSALAALSKSYQDTATGLAALPVPEELVEQDRAIINSLMRLGQIYGDFARVEQDPLTATLALQQYKNTELSTEQAFTALASIYAAGGVVLPSGTPGAAFVNLMANIGAQQVRSQTP